MEEYMNQLFMAHHTEKEFIHNNCNHYFYRYVSIAEMQAEAGHVTEPYSHAHDAYEFLIPYGPLPMLMYKVSVYFGEPGYIYPVQSGEEHASKLRISGVSHDSIVVERKYMEDIIAMTPYTGMEFDGKAELTQELSLYIKLFKEVCKKKEKEAETIRDRKLQSLMELICLELVSSVFGKSRMRKEEQWQYQQGLYSVAAYMNEHYREKLNIETLAGMAGLSKNYFISSFKKFMGEPPLSYLVKLRISYAKIMLEYGEESISEVARQCGFRRANTFSAIFKKETGVSPSEYRRIAEK